MIILGLNYYFHDSSACIVRDGELISAIEEERLNREKHTREFPRLSTARCLKDSGLSYEDVDYIAVSIKPRHNWMNKIWYVFRYFLGFINSGNLSRFTAYHLGHTYLMQRNFWSWYREHWGNGEKKPKVYFIEHHLTHVAGSFFISPYKSAALLGVDGSGEWATTWIGQGKKMWRSFGW